MKIRCCLLLCLIFSAALSLNRAGANETLASKFYLGVDLSYVNEMDDCGATYPGDPYEIFHDYGANLVRIRLWHTPTWTNYSNFEDVVRSLQRADAFGMDVLLDFHNSDTWADPAKQIIPAAWAEITDVEELGQAVYQYTFDTLTRLDELGLMPEIVQVGNEINSEVLRAENSSGYPIDWERNAALINSGIQGVRDAGAQSSEVPKVLLHVAQPEAVEGWLLAATHAGVTDFDIVGLSYYPGWSDNSIETTGSVINQLRHKFATDIMIVETAYPWTFDSADRAGNVMGEDFLLDGYPATPDGQKQFMVDLTQTVFANGGLGVVYWEPAWVSTECRTLWGQGSHWENATFFDFNNENALLSGIEFLQYPYEYPVEVSLQFTFDGGDTPEEIFFWGDFTGTGRRMLRLPLVDGAYTLNTRLLAGTEIHYQFYGDTPASAETALLAGECLDSDGYVSVRIPEGDVLIQHIQNECPTVE